MKTMIFLMSLMKVGYYRQVRPIWAIYHYAVISFGSTVFFYSLGRGVTKNILIKNLVYMGNKS